MGNRLKLQRHYENDNYTLGTLLVLNEKGMPIFACFCIERGDLDNAVNVSNFPPGTYDIKYEWSPKFKKNLWELKGVPNRSEIKIHQANFWRQLEGCIAPGLGLKNIDNDEELDVTYSEPALNALHKALKGQLITTIEVIDPL